MLNDLNELTPYERELLRQVVIIHHEQRPEVGVHDAERELRIPAPLPPNYRN